MVVGNYNVRHIPCTMNDFNSDCHRFSFNYNNKEYVVPCYGAFDILFGEIETEVPENVLCEIQNIIWDKIDKEEKNWKYPNEAYDIADEYVEENFN